MTHDIKKIYQIKEEDLTILGVNEGEYRGEAATVIEAVYSPNPTACRACGSSPIAHNGKPIVVKNGKKKTCSLLTNENTGPVVMVLKKQRYRCYNCDTYRTAQVSFLNPRATISRIIDGKIIELLGERISLKLIAKLCHVSVKKVLTVMESLKEHLPQPGETKLPEVLMVDEFRSHATAEDKMSFICANGETGELVDILPSRKFEQLEKHFKKIEEDNRLKVKFLVTDMNAPYFKLTHKIFPNAQLIIDRFHIVKHLNEAFNSYRVRDMKRMIKNGQKVEASKLKTNWRYFLKNRMSIDISEYKRWRSFKSNRYPWMTEDMMIDRLLSYSPELKTVYGQFHDILDAFRRKEASLFFELLRDLPMDIDEEFRDKVQNLLNYEEGITNALTYTYSNGKIEAKNTHIKTLKRVSYGFKSFENMRTRIFLAEGLLKVKN